MITIEKVDDRQKQKAFIDFPWGLYRDNPTWIPPLKYELKQRINIQKNSFLRPERGELILAKREGRIVGRMSVSMDAANAKKSEGATGNFGCYEAIDDVHVGMALMEYGTAWLRKRGVSKVLGPIHFRLEDPYPGFLVEGFEHAPYFMMTYSAPYYDDQMMAMGFTPSMNLHAYEVSAERKLPKKFIERAAEAEKIPGIHLRNINMKCLHEEAELIGDIFNEALRKNWGHVPFTKRHIHRMASDLKMLADPRIIFISEVDGRAVGAVINLPNYNDILYDLNGSLFPRGFTRILFQKKRIKSLRGYAMGVRDEYQGSGVGCLMVRESFASGIKVGYERGEVTWVLGSNQSMNKLSEWMGGNRNKTYRLYEKYL